MQRVSSQCAHQPLPGIVLLPNALALLFPSSALLLLPRKCLLNSKLWGNLYMPGNADDEKVFKSKIKLLKRTHIASGTKFIPPTRQLPKTENDKVYSTTRYAPWLPSPQTGPLGDTRYQRMLTIPQSEIGLSRSIMRSDLTGMEFLSGKRPSRKSYSRTHQKLLQTLTILGVLGSMPIRSLGKTRICLTNGA